MLAMVLCTYGERSKFRSQGMHKIVLAFLQLLREKAGEVLEDKVDILLVQAAVL